MFTAPFSFLVPPAASYLLDIYPTAKRAYSLRKINSSYLGSALRVRRASDNTEQDIGFVGEDLDTSALTTFCAGTDGFVTTWYDQSGNAENASQSTASYQPQIITSGSIYTTGSKLSIYAQNNHIMNFTAFTTTLNANLLVGKKASATSNRMIGIGGYKINGAAPMLSHWEDSNIYLQWYTKYSYPNSAISNINYEVLLGTTLTASTSEIWRNGSNLALSNNTDNSINNDFSQLFRYANANQYSNAYFQELVIWDFDESVNAAGILDNINNYYSIY